MTTPPPMPAQPPTAGTPNFTLAPAPATPPAPAPAPPTGGGILAPVTLARPTRDPSGGSAAHTSQDENSSTPGKPGKGEKNTANPGMWKGIAALIANRPQRKMTVQHTISEIRGTSTDRKINHGVTEKRGSTSDTKSNRSATTAHASKSDKSAKTAATRDAKTSAASTKADKTSRDAKTADTRSAAKKDNRDAKTADTRSSADKTSRDAKTADTRASADKTSRDTKDASDRKDHSTRQQADKTSADKQNRAARDDKTLRKTDTAERQPPAGKHVSADPSKTAPNTPKTLGPVPARKDSATQPKDQPATTEPPAPSGAQDKAKPKKGPYTAQPAREDGFKAGAQEAATEADKGAWRDGYEDGQQAIRDKAARDRAQMDAARDHARGVQPVKPSIPPKPSSPPAKPPVPPKPATPPNAPVPTPSAPATPTATKPTAAPAVSDRQQAIRAVRARMQGTPPVPANPAPNKPFTPAPTMGAQPLGAALSRFGDVELSNGRGLTTGEVRTLRKLTQFLTGKEQETHQIADECKQAKEVSAGRVNEIQKLIEDCQNPKIKGGKQLTAALQKLLEATTIQAREAEKMHGNAVRGIDALKTLNQNAQIRHGGVYKAVADSPETAPAERPFYNR
ncbi:hypothetical protein [Streptomyces microflavus]|uniref:hypothetical protein n=1 Tax=Streptomyces microflavus TaxID=1919 RepID=UPI0033D61023